MHITLNGVCLFTWLRIVDRSSSWQKMRVNEESYFADGYVATSK